MAIRCFPGHRSRVRSKTLGLRSSQRLRSGRDGRAHRLGPCCHALVPASSVKELIDYAKANPGKLNWGFGQGTAPHMFGELFKAETGIDVANIPYKSGTLAVPDLLGGRIDMNFGTLSNLLPLIREGKLRALAVTSEARSPDLPDVPTMTQSGFPRLTRGDWIGLWARQERRRTS